MFFLCHTWEVRCYLGYGDRWKTTSYQWLKPSSCFANGKCVTATGNLCHSNKSRYRILSFVLSETVVLILKTALTDDNSPWKDLQTELFHGCYRYRSVYLFPLAKSLVKPYNCVSCDFKQLFLSINKTFIHLLCIYLPDYKNVNSDFVWRFAYFTVSSIDFKLRSCRLCLVS